MPEWRLGPLARLDEAAATAAVEARFRQIHQARFAGDPACNHRLPIAVRAFRRQEGWAVFLLLTPWMLARVFLPAADPGLPLPPGWSAAEREGEAYVPAGPPLELALAGGRQLAHLNHDLVLGHYLIQPLAQAMARYDSADTVFAAWNGVVAAGGRSLDDGAANGDQPPSGKDFSRRQFFSRLMGGSQ